MGVERNKGITKIELSEILNRALSNAFSPILKHLARMEHDVAVLKIQNDRTEETLRKLSNRINAIEQDLKRIKRLRD